MRFFGNLIFWAERLERLLGGGGVVFWEFDIFGGEVVGRALGSHLENPLSCHLILQLLSVGGCWMRAGGG